MDRNKTPCNQHREERPNSRITMAQGKQPQINWKTGRMKLTELTHKEQIAAAMRRDRERQAKETLKKEQLLKKEKSDKGAPIAIVATMEQELLMRSHYIWPQKLQNCTILFNLEAIQTTIITSKIF